MKTRKTISQKVLLSAAAVTTAIGLAGVGTLATWTETDTSAPQTLATGTFNFAGDFAGVTGATNLVPGDSVSRMIKLSDTGDVEFGSMSMTVSATGDTSVLDNGTNEGFTLKLERCSDSSCTTATTLYDTTPVGTYDLSSSPLMAADHTVDDDWLRATLTFDATNTDYASFNAKSVVLTYTVTATQRAGSAH